MSEHVPNAGTLRTTPAEMYESRFVGSLCNSDLGKSVMVRGTRGTLAGIWHSREWMNRVTIYFQGGAKLKHLDPNDPVFVYVPEAAS